MPALACSDCGKPAEGKFDLRQRMPSADLHLKALTDDPYYRTHIDRPLCPSCMLNRGLNAAGLIRTPAGPAPPAPPSPPAPPARSGKA